MRVKGHHGVTSFGKRWFQVYVYMEERMGGRRWPDSYLGPEGLRRLDIALDRLQDQAPEEDLAAVRVARDVLAANLEGRCVGP